MSAAAAASWEASRVGRWSGRRKVTGSRKLSGGPSSAGRGNARAANDGKGKAKVVDQVEENAIPVTQDAV